LPERVDFRALEVQELIAALEAELRALYGRPDQDAPPLDAFDAGAFVVIRDEAGRAVACGGLRELEPGVGEIKRMYTVPDARGLGHGRAILDALLDVARELGLARVVIETGVRQPAAVAMYEHAGFASIPRYGPYELETDSVCMGRDVG